MVVGVYGGVQIYLCLCVVGYVIVGNVLYVCFCQFLEYFFYGGQIGKVVDVVIVGEYVFDVVVEDCMVIVLGLVEDCGGGIVVDVGQGVQCVEIVWQFVIVIGYVVLCGGMQVVCMCVVVKFGLLCYYGVVVGCGQCGQGGEDLQECQKVWNDCIDLGLLQYDF